MKENEEFLNVHNLNNESVKNTVVKGWMEIYELSGYYELESCLRYMTRGEELARVRVF